MFSISPFRPYRTTVTVLRVHSGRFIKVGRTDILAGVITASAIRIRRCAAFSARVAGAAKETVAEGVGFEPTRHFCPPVFKTGSIGRSDSPPDYKPSLADTPAVETPASGNRLGSCCDFDTSASHNNYQVD